MIRVLIADDQKQVRESYSPLLGREHDLEIVGQARDGREAVDLVSKFSPQVVTMDLKMPRMDGWEATKRIHVRTDGPWVHVVAMSWEEEQVKRALDCGANGYVAKTDAFQELAPAIRDVSAGKRYFTQQLTPWRSLLGTPDA